MSSAEAARARRSDFYAKKKNKTPRSSQAAASIGNPCVSVPRCVGHCGTRIKGMIYVSLPLCGHSEYFLCFFIRRAWNDKRNKCNYTILNITSIISDVIVNLRTRENCGVYLCLILAFWDVITCRLMINTSAAKNYT